MCDVFKTVKCRVACREVVDYCRSVCFRCCEGDGFYKNCVKPFENFLERVGCEEPI